MHRHRPTYVQEKRADNKAQSLTIANLGIVETVGLDDIEQRFLTKSLGLEVLVVGECSAHIALDLLLV